VGYRHLDGAWKTRAPAFVVVMEDESFPLGAREKLRADKPLNADEGVVLT